MPRQSLKQRCDKRYRAWYKGKQFYGGTQKEARQKRDEYKRQVEAGINVAEAGVTVGDYCGRWVDTYKASSSETVRITYRKRLARFCRFEVKKTQIGHLPIKVITASDIQSFYNSLAGMSYSSVSKHVIAVRAVFRSAIADRIIIFDPTTAAKPPKAEQGTHRAITMEERALIHNVPHKLQVFALVMLYAGLRRGEVLGLEIEKDIDFKNKLIHVRRAVSFSYSGKASVSKTKTEASVRDVPLLDVLVPYLEGRAGSIVSFKNSGSFIYCWGSYMEALSKAAGKPIHIQTHDLRHSYCTMMYDAGVDVKTAQAYMGHASLQMTLSIYTHLSEERKKSATEALEKEARKLAAVQNTVPIKKETAENADD